MTEEILEETLREILDYAHKAREIIFSKRLIGDKKSTKAQN